MEALEKAKLALRNFLLENKEKVRADLEYMRSKSVGNDIYNYVDSYSNSLSVLDIKVVNESLVDVDIVDVDYYNLNQDWNIGYQFYPPSMLNENTNKGSENSQSLFFLILLHYVRSKRCLIFV